VCRILEKQPGVRVCVCVCVCAGFWLSWSACAAVFLLKRGSECSKQGSNQVISAKLNLVDLAGCVPLTSSAVHLTTTKCPSRVDPRRVARLPLRVYMFIELYDPPPHTHTHTSSGDL